MAIEAARLASGTIAPSPEAGINEICIGQLYTTDEPDIRAVIKAVTPKQIANELIASALTEALSLPSPRGFLVFADPEDAFGCDKYSTSNGDLVYFGSELSNRKTLIAFFSANSLLAFKAVHENEKWGNILAFDEWTANADRHLNNFMYDGSEIILFDHDQCLTGPYWVPTDLNPTGEYPCHDRIVQLHRSMSKDDKEAAVDLASKFQQLAIKLDINQIINGSLASEIENNIPDDLPAAERFLVERAKIIKDLCDKRLA